MPRFISELEVGRGVPAEPSRESRAQIASFSHADRPTAHRDGSPYLFRRAPALSALALLLALATPAVAQIVVELPFDPGIPARVTVSKSWTDPTLTRTTTQPPIAQSAASAANIKLPQITTSSTPSPAPSSTPSLVELLGAIIPPSLELVPKLTPLPSSAYASPPTAFLLSSFNGDPASGAVIPTSTWVGNVTQNSGYITIGGTARNDNGWRATGLSLDASGMNFITITAQRDVGNATGALFLQFEDINLRTRVFSLSTSSFALGTPTQAQIVLGVWSGDFDFTQIVSWSIGGGSVGSHDFRMSLHQVEFAASAIPEPATYAACFGVVALAMAVIRRRRSRCDHTAREV